MSLLQTLHWPKVNSFISLEDQHHNYWVRNTCCACVSGKAIKVMEGNQQKCFETPLTLGGKCIRGTIVSPRLLLIDISRVRWFLHSDTKAAVLGLCTNKSAQRLCAMVYRWLPPPVACFCIALIQSRGWLPMNAPWGSHLRMAEFVHICADDLWESLNRMQRNTRMTISL